MPQCFDFEDTNGAWEALAAGLEPVLEEVDQNELYEAEQISLKDYDTDVERVMDEAEDSTGTLTGYSSPVGLMSPVSLSLPVGRDTCAVTDLMSKMDDETLRKHVLGSYNKIGIFGSGENLNVPKSPNELRSTSVPLPLEDDDQAEFLPSKNKKSKCFSGANKSSTFVKPYFSLPFYSATLQCSDAFNNQTRIRRQRKGFKTQENEKKDEKEATKFE